MRAHNVKTTTTTRPHKSSVNWPQFDSGFTSRFKFQVFLLRMQTTDNRQHNTEQVHRSRKTPDSNAPPGASVVWYVCSTQQYVYTTGDSHIPVEVTNADILFTEVYGLATAWSAAVHGQVRRTKFQLFFLCQNTGIPVYFAQGSRHARFWPNYATAVWVKCFAAYCPLQEANRKRTIDAAVRFLFPFIFCSQFTLSLSYFSSSLPFVTSRTSDPGSHRGHSFLPPSRHDTRLRFYRGESWVFSPFFDSRGIVHTHELIPMLKS